MRNLAFHPALLLTLGVFVLAGCAVPPTPSADQSSIVSRLPGDYVYTAPVQTAGSLPPPGAAPLPTPAPVQTPTPALSEQERQRYADIDKQVQREQTQSMAAYEAARYAYYYPQPIYYAAPVVVGGYYGGYYGGYGGYGYRGCCWGGGPRWSVGVGYSTGWGW
jgi:hypothetical protein